MNQTPDNRQIANELKRISAINYAILAIFIVVVAEAHILFFFTRASAQSNASEMAKAMQEYRQAIQGR